MGHAGFIRGEQMNKLYYVHMKGEDWGVMVIAESSRQAKYQGYAMIITEYGYTQQECKYIDIRCRQKKDAVIPDNETQKVFDGCGADLWLCKHWGNCDNEDCPKYAEKMRGENEI
jgi:hypothetical protein